MDAAVRGLWYVLCGLFSGVLAGMGMGGGTLLIPALTLLLGMGQHQAQGVNMLAFLPAGLLAVYIHRKEGRVALKSVWPILAAGMAGAALGALAAAALEGGWLRRIFGAFLLILGIAHWKKS